MPDTTALTDRALAAADAFIAEHLAHPAFAEHRVLFRAALAMMWVEGRQAGGLEAGAIIRAKVAELMAK